MIKQKTIVLLFVFMIYEVDSWLNPITFIYSIFGLRKPVSTNPCVTTNLPDNACSLSDGFEVAAWPPYSQKMFFLYYKTCDAIVDKRIFRRKPYIKYDYANEDRWYCVMMLDRDSKGLDNGEYLLHFLACNIDLRQRKKKISFTYTENEVKPYIGVWSQIWTMVNN